MRLERNKIDLIVVFSIGARRILTSPKTKRVRGPPHINGVYFCAICAVGLIGFISHLRQTSFFVKDILAVIFPSLCLIDIVFFVHVGVPLMANFCRKSVSFFQQQHTSHNA